MKVLKQKLILLLTATIVVMLAWSVALADDDGPQQSTTGPTPPQAVVERDAGSADDGPQQSKTGPTPPTAVIERDAQGGSPPAQGGAQYTIAGVPEYNWRHGCGPTAVGMVVGYYDTHGYDDLIPGDANTQTAAVNQAIASQGSAVNPLHYEDYSLPIDTPATGLLRDNSPNYPWGTHADDSIADFMETSWFTRNNYYGWSWSSDICPSFTGYVNLQNSSYNPACTECRWSTGALTWAVLTSEIDNGRPMVFLVDSDGNGGTDHFVTVVGYDDGTPHKYGCLDTWAASPGIRWEIFQGIGSGAWSIWGGWTFQLAGVQPPPTTKWIQMPDETENGIDIRCDHSDGGWRTLADDFECTTSGLITDVHIWGSWKNDYKGDITLIHLSIHEDIPADPNQGSYSMPGNVLWERDFAPYEFNEVLYKELSYYEWWWDPWTGEPDPYGDQTIWQYDIYIDPCGPGGAFRQAGTPDEPVVYWLDVYVETAYEGQFGWKTSKDHWNDDAVWSGDGWLELIYPLGHPYEGDSIDMAFAITTEQEPNEPTTKWVQLPDLSETGIDVNATAPYILADDFECKVEGPITEITIWGSWLYDHIPYWEWPEGVTFTLSIHEDIPADPNLGSYSMPGELLWMKTFQPGEFTAEIYAGDIEEGWLDPPMRYFFPADWTCWQYTFQPRDSFIQQGDPWQPDYLLAGRSGHT